MNIDLNVRFFIDPTLRVFLQSILGKVNTIMATQAEHAGKLENILQVVIKVGQETTATLAKVAELEAALAAGGTTTPEVDALVDDITSRLNVTDSLVRDIE